MKDFIPKGTGNSRFLKSVADFMARYPTYADFAAALIAGTLPVDFNGINAAGVAEMGTPLNRQTMLSPEVQALLGLPDDATPSDALLATVDKTEIARITTSGTWVCPEGVTEIDVYLVGGGEGGSVGATTSGEGGAGGYAFLAEGVSVTPGNAYDIEIGAGGARVSGASGQRKPGGNTSAFGFTVYGGGHDVDGAIKIGAGGTNGPSYNARGKSGGDISTGWMYQINPYDGLPYGNAGSSSSFDGAGAISYVGKNMGGAGAKDASTNYSNLVKAGDGTDGGGEGGYGSVAGGGGGGPGGGGGCAKGTGSSQNNYKNVYSGAGGAGIVIIYA